MSLDAMKQALEALEEMKAEFRALDLPYGSEAYTKANNSTHVLRAAIEQAQEPVAWHPIETAPKDRTVLVCRRHSTIPTMAKWNAEYEWFEDFYMDHLYDLTHWLPLPPAPSKSN